MNITLGLKKVALAASIALIAAPAFAQTTATTDPVGFVTMTIAAGTGSASNYSFNGMALTRTVSYQGTAETATAATTTLIDNEAVWTDNQFNGASSAITHYVEITSGSSAGTTYDITGTTASTKTLTLAQPLAAGVAAGASFKIRQHWTVASIFGAADEAGLTGGTSSTADQILINNGAGFDTYYYKTTGPGGIGWRSTASVSVDRSGTLIYPDDSLVVKRTAATAVNVVIMGSVKTGQSSYPVATGNTFIANPCAAPLTLASCGIYTTDANTGLLGGTSGTADKITLWNGAAYDTYYYKTTGPGGTGWRSTSSISIDASAIPIAVGTSVVVVRSGAAFNWVIPQHPAVL